MNLYKKYIALIFIMEDKKFSCDITSYSISFKINKLNNEAYMEVIECDYYYPKFFFKLLRDSSDYFKENGVVTIKQLVSKIDYEQFLKGNTTWEIDKIHIDDTITLKCKTTDFLKNMQNGLGVEL